MMDFMFFVKSVLLTLVLVVLMQIRIGEQSIEHHAHSFVQSSAIAAPLNSVAQGAAKLVRDGVAKVNDLIHGRKSNKKHKEEKASSSSFRWSSDFRRKPESDED